MVLQKSWYGVCFSYYGVRPTYQISGIMDQFEYIRMLEEIMVLYAEEEMPLKSMFEQDNDPKHTSMRATSFFQTKSIEAINPLTSTMLKMG